MKIIDQDRLLIEVDLEPVQGSRFQPTGFPNLGAAEFTSGSDSPVDCLLVESSQSMANGLEAVCWDSKSSSLAKPLVGLPVITVVDKKGEFLTNSLLEAHRMNSSYILEGTDKTFFDMIKEELNITDDKEHSVDIEKFASFALRYDPNSIIHGVFLSKKDIAGGRYKMTRSLSAFIEARGVKRAVSGGVKIDHLDPSGGEEGAKSGFGHIPYNKTEYTASTITAFFSIDVALIKSYNLGDAANDLLFTLALWKIQSFLSGGLRLRTACDLKTKGKYRVSGPIKIPDSETLTGQVQVCIKKCKSNGLFGDPIKVKYQKPKNTKASK